MDIRQGLVHGVLETNRSESFRLIRGLIRFGQEMNPACRPMLRGSTDFGRKTIRGQSFRDRKVLKFSKDIGLSEW